MLSRVETMPDERLNKNGRGWAHLHKDILLRIKGNLLLVDLLCFRAVCKSWRSLSPVKSADKLPWIFVCRWIWKPHKDRFVGHDLFNPSIGKEYRYGHELKPSSNHPMIVYGSKYGWIFLAAPLGRPETVLFLHHAFTMRTINLPALKGVDLHGSIGSFSTNPTCSDCVFYVIRRFQVSREYRLYTYRNGGETWLTFDLHLQGPGTPFFYVTFGKGSVHSVFPDGFDVTFRKGLMYFVFPEGLLWEFNTATGDYKQLHVDRSEIKNIMPIIKEYGGYEIKMVESDGEFLLVHYCKNRLPWYIFKLDWTMMAWVEERTLNNRAIFLGVTSLSVLTVGEIKSLEGRIYFHSLRSFNYHNFKNSAHQNSSHFYSECKDYYPIKRFTDDYQWVWIEPYL